MKKLTFTASILASSLLAFSAQAAITKNVSKLTDNLFNKASDNIVVEQIDNSNNNVVNITQNSWGDSVNGHAVLIDFDDNNASNVNIYQGDMGTKGQNETYVNFSGYNNDANVVQRGYKHETKLVVNGASNNNFLNVTQIGSNADAIVKLTNSSRNIAVINHNTNDFAKIVANGSNGNTFRVNQN